MLINHSVDCIVGMTHSHELHAECKPVPAAKLSMELPKLRWYCIPTASQQLCWIAGFAFGQGQGSSQFLSPAFGAAPSATPAFGASQGLCLSAAYC